MSEVDYSIAFDDKQIAILLLKILRKKERINEPTYSKVLQLYLEKLKEAA